MSARHCTRDTGILRRKKHQWLSLFNQYGLIWVPKHLKNSSYSFNSPRVSKINRAVKEDMFWFTQGVSLEVYWTPVCWRENVKLPYHLIRWSALIVSWYRPSAFNFHCSGRNIINQYPATPKTVSQKHSIDNFSAFNIGPKYLVWLASQFTSFDNKQLHL